MVLCIIQARMGSTRLPGKVLLPAVSGTSMLEYELLRVQQSKKIDKIVIATTDKPDDDKIHELCNKIGVDCFRGSETDVLDRYVQCARQHPTFDVIVRITGDCPVIDPVEIDRVITYFLEHDLDYACNNAFSQETFPDGLDTEVFSRQALERAYQEAQKASEHEHVTLYIKQSESFKKGSVAADVDFSHFRLTLDEQADYEVLKFVIENSDLNDDYLKYISLLTEHPEIMGKNMQIQRNEGHTKSHDNDSIVKG